MYICLHTSLYIYILSINIVLNLNRRIKGVNGEEMARMSDEAFENICNFMTDISYRIRTQASKLLGTFLSVSSSVLLKTLDQTLMSNLRVNIKYLYKHNILYMLYNSFIS